MAYAGFNWIKHLGASWGSEPKPYIQDNAYSSHFCQDVKIG